MAKVFMILLLKILIYPKAYYTEANTSEAASKSTKRIPNKLRISHQKSKNIKVEIYLILQIKVCKMLILFHWLKMRTVNKNKRNNKIRLRKKTSRLLNKMTILISLNKSKSFILKNILKDQGINMNRTNSKKKTQKNKKKFCIKGIVLKLRRLNGLDCGLK